jgi:hypothetical protein
MAAQFVLTAEPILRQRATATNASTVLGSGWADQRIGYAADSEAMMARSHFDIFQGLLVQ